MPIIFSFFGIYIRMYFSDHAPPHRHVDDQGMKHSSPSPMARWLKVSFLAAP